MKITKKSNGFTLIEIMVAVAILGILVSGIYGLYTSIFNNYVSQNQLADVEQNARTGIEQMMREIRLAGFNAQGSQVYKTTASDFVFQEQVQPIFAGGAVVNKKIEYYWDSAKQVLIRGEQSEISPSVYPSDIAPITQTPQMTLQFLQTLASPVSNMSFTYYDANNLQLIPTNSSNFNTITRVRVTLTTQGSQPSPDKIGVLVNGKYYKQVTVDADIRLRNMGIGQANADTTPPSAPTGIQVRDTGNPCASLTVSWNANTETDLAGYAIYFRRTGSGAPYTFVNVGNTTTYILQKLSIGTTYDVTLKAYDTSGNFSGYGAIISVANTNSNDGTQDTQPNILPPSPPAITTAAAGNKQVTLTWSPSSTGNINGYNIYRSAYSGNAYGSFMLVNQTGPVTGTNFIDTFSDPAAPAAPNCPLTYKNPHPYQYRMTSVDCSGTGGEGTSSSVISGADGSAPYNTYPKDSIVPADPSNFAAGAGSQQVFLSWNAPADLDIMGVMILSRDNSTVSPTISSFSRTVYQDVAVITPNQSYGSVDNGQNLTGTPLSPLPNYQRYAYTAFAFDKCGNFSTGVGSTASAMPCGDGSWPGAPGPPSLLNGSSFGGVVTLTWTAPTTNSQNSPVTGSNTNYSANPVATNPPTPVWDLSGYNVYRCPYVPGAVTQKCDKTVAVDYNNVTGNPLNTSPVLNPTFNDTQVAPGQIWLYAVTAIDCMYPTTHDPKHESLSATDTNGVSPQQYVQVAVGGLEQDVYFVKGTSTGGNNWTSLNDMTQSFVTSPAQAYSTGTLKIISGTDVGQWRPVIANGATFLTIPNNYPWSTSLPDTTSLYEIDRPITARSSNPSSNPLAHDDVAFWIKNTNPAQINLRQNLDTAAVTWSNYQGLSGLDKSGVPVSLIAIRVNGTTLWSVNPGFGVSSGTNVTLTSAISFSGLQKGIPMELVFSDSNGNPPNMKGETINISMTYQVVNQDGTFTNGTWTTGVNGFQAIQVPYGINYYYYNWLGGTVFQIPTNLGQPPYATTFSATNILSQGSGPVTIWTDLFDSAYVSPNLGGAIPTSAILYYCKQTYAGSASWGSNVTPTAPGPTNPCWQSMNMTIFSPGSPSTWVNASIPENNDPYRIWYYVQTTDNIGNSSSNPSYNINGMNAYTYDQNDGFSNPSFTLSWTSASTAGTYGLTVNGTVGDAGNGTNNTAGANVTNLYFTGTAYGTLGPLTYTLTPGSNTFTSNQVFLGNEKGSVSFQIQKPGFASIACTGSNLNNANGNPGSIPLTCK